MSTLSNHRPDLTATQRWGLKLTVVGLLLYLAYPVVELAGLNRTPGRIIPFVLISPYAAGVLVWGVFVLQTGKRRPLTPRRALLIPVLVIPMFVVADLVARGRVLDLWEYLERAWPQIDLETITWYVSAHLGMTASSTYAVLGSAVRTRRWDATLSAIGLILIVTWVYMQRPYAQPPELTIAVFGIIPFVIGYRATGSPEE